MKRKATRRVALLLGALLVAVPALSATALAVTSPLAVTRTAPAGGTTEVSRTANVKAYFNHDMRASTVTSTTYKIRKQGTTTWLGAARSVNNTISPTSTNGGSQSVVTLNPNADLALNTTYQVMIAGGSSGIKDLSGNTLSSNKSWTFTTVAPPNTTINSGPSGTVASTSASFTFSSSKPNSTFQCSLDNSAFAGCTSPKSYSGLSQGLHNFRVRAIASGITDQTAASQNWTVDTVAPDTSITAKPDDPSNDASPSFTFSSSEQNSTFECKLDNEASYVSCTSPKALSNLSDGSHTFSVRAKDAAGNVDPTPASYTWTVATTPIVATPSTVDFGGFAYCWLDPSPVENVTLKNITTEPITVAPSVSGTGASRFSVPTDQITLAPGDTAVLPVTFTPAFGSFTASLELKDASGNTVLTVPLTASGRCPIEG